MNRYNYQLPSRGRGRGRRSDGGGNQQDQRMNPSTSAPFPRASTWNGRNEEVELATVEERFKQASEKHKQRYQDLLKKDHSLKTEQQSNSNQVYEYLSSSEEEDLDDEKIISKLTETYQGHGKGDEDLQKTSQYLIECCQSGALDCLVCLSSIKRVESVWSCRKCYACFHLDCIRKWINEGIVKKILADELLPDQEHPWHCPKCRNEYKREECPFEYRCFCGKEHDPQPDAWTLPHSCGQVCDRPLARCQHRCLLLCHPGPCPPCPQTVPMGCHCGKSAAVPRRCGAGKWACGATCDKLLACGRHRCQKSCHRGECERCTHVSVVKCRCGASERPHACADGPLRCDKKCDRVLPCGVHRCEVVCHPLSECSSECPHASGVRTCPCGKSTYEGLTCVEQAPVCNDTCEKELACGGNHLCMRRCHHGDCGPCPAVRQKSCRCGKREKHMQCGKEFTCDNKCLRIRSCGIHPCKKKCCDGNCPECQQICNKYLMCRKHRCKSLCHRGQCFPCTLTTSVSCPCGSTVSEVACGLEKTAKPKRCLEPCKIASNCHHPERKFHTCHVGKCPPCNRICDVELNCGHKCPEVCHDNVPSKKALRPWEPVTMRIEKRPCPPCKVPVGLWCLGRHDMFIFECHEAREHSCGSKCGRVLACTNHKCEKECHVVENAPDDVRAGENCRECERECCFERPPGCVHPCSRPCHPGPCPPCKKKIRKRCHCGRTQIKFICSDWTSASHEKLATLQSCEQECPNKLQACGHPCPLNCHPGPCPSSLECGKKLVIKCSCKRLKKEVICKNEQAKQTPTVVLCDEECKRIKRSRAEEQRTAGEEKRKKKQRKEMENEEATAACEAKTSKKSRYYKGKVRYADDDNDDVSTATKLSVFTSPLFAASLVVLAAIVAVLFVFHQQQL